MGLRDRLSDVFKKGITLESFIAGILESNLAEYARELQNKRFKDFSALTTYRNEDTGISYEKLEYYIKKNERSFRDAPINISKSTARHLQAEGLYMPWLKAPDADLRGANFSEAGSHKATYLYGADFTRAKLMESYFNNANLKGVWFSGADLSKAILEGADLENAQLDNAKFYGTNLRGVKNLEKADGIAYAKYKKTIVTEKEYEIIQNAFDKAGRKFDCKLFKIKELEPLGHNLSYQ